MRKYLTRNAPVGLMLFIGSRLAIFIAVITVFSIAQPTAPQEPARPTAAIVAPPVPGLTFSLHATNLAEQFTRITELQNDEQTALCGALTTYGCDGTNAARCTAIVNYCDDELGALDDAITDELMGAMAVYEHGFTGLETAYDAAIAHGEPLDDDALRLRMAYRAVLFGHLNDLGALLLQRNGVLQPLRDAAREINDATMLATLRLDERSDLVREALDASAQSLQVVNVIIQQDRPPPDNTGHDVFLPPCGGDVQCWKI
ncbi:hypothetical protein HY634_03255 [Candidatus Uhrbacteria bacterium]|nr:hypothetical protein [Candidatus Uhrbacteria bacterium]